MEDNGNSICFINRALKRRHALDVHGHVARGPVSNAHILGVREDAFSHTRDPAVRSIDKPEENLKV